MEINSSTNANGLLNGNGQLLTNGLDSAAKSKLVDQVIFKYLKKFFLTIKQLIKRLIIYKI